MTAEFEKLVQYLCDYFKITIPELRAKNRHGEVIKRKHFVVAYLRLTIAHPRPGFKKYTLGTIAFDTGTRSHATVLNSCKYVQNGCDTDKGIKILWDDFTKYADKYWQ